MATGKNVKRNKSDEFRNTSWNPPEQVESQSVHIKCLLVEGQGLRVKGLFMESTGAGGVTVTG